MQAVSVHIFVTLVICRLFQSRSKSSSWCDFGVIRMSNWSDSLVPAIAGSLR